MNKKLKKFLIFDLVLLLLVLAGFAALQFINGLEMKGEPEVTINVGEEFYDPGVKSKFAETSGDVDTSNEGDYTVEYSLAGKTVTRTVHVVDPSHVVLGLKGDMHQKVLVGNPYIEGGAFAIDKRIGALDEDTISISGEVDTKTPGSYKIIYEVTSQGISKSLTRTVEVLSEEDFGKKAENVPVMMYHWIYTKNDVPENLDGNWILNTKLEKHLKYLVEEEYYFPSFAELRAWVDGKIELPARSIIMTFDDGKEAFLKYGKTLFEEYKVPVTSYMIGWDKNKSKKKIKEYASEYIQFQNHTYAMHQAGTAEGYRGIIANKDKSEMLNDFKKCEAIIKNNDSLAYPYGDCPPEALKAVKEQGFCCAFTTVIDKVRRGQDYRELPRVRVYGDSSFETWKNSIK